MTCFAGTILKDASYGGSPCLPVATGFCQRSQRASG